MRKPLALCLVLFGLVLLTTGLRIVWPGVVLFALSVVFLVNHLAMAHGLILKHQMGNESLRAMPHGFAANVALSYLGLIIVALSLLVRGIGGGSGISGGDSGQGPGVDEITLIGPGGEALKTEVVPGGGGSGDGIDQTGSGEGEGAASGVGDGAGGFADVAAEVVESGVVPLEGDPVEGPAGVEMEPDETIAQPVLQEEPPPEEVPPEEAPAFFPVVRKERFTMPFDPQSQSPLGTKVDQGPGRGGAPAYGSVASVDGSGTVVKPDKDTNILIFFDSSGSMNSTFEPLQVMRDTLLRKALLPCYGSVELYEERVRVLSERDERGLAWLGKGFETSKSIVLIFQDESAGTYYHAGGRLFPVLLQDLYHLRKAVEEFDGSYYRGVVFQVKNRSSGPRFQKFLRNRFQAPPFHVDTIGELAVAIGSNKGRRFRSPFGGPELADFDPAGLPPRTPAHLADFLRRSGSVSFDLKFNIPEGVSPEFYLDRITRAARELGIDLSAS